jgi:glutathione-independent formaldehyde dehydrogenase
MRAVVLRGRCDIAVEEVPDPDIEAPDDAIVAVTSSALCGSDLHMIEGRIGPDAGLRLGHEPLGVVTRVGPGVSRIQPGQRVVAPTHIFCGTCDMCARGYSAACLRVNPGRAGAAYGYPGMGGYPGAHAEYLRVPFADANLVTLPGEPGDEYEDHFVLLADAFVTGWHATELAGVGPGDTVAVFGAGTVGLLAVHAAMLRGAREVYCVDAVPDRLAVAADFGAVPVDAGSHDPVERIRALRAPTAIDPLLGGVDCGIDAVGFQAKDRADWSRENPGQVIDDLVRLVNPAGRLGIAGVFTPLDQAAQGPARQGRYEIPWAALFGQGVRVGFGRTHDVRYTRLLRDLVVSGRARPGHVVTRHVGFDDVAHAYTAFDRREPGHVKVVLRPGSH